MHKHTSFLRVLTAITLVALIRGTTLAASAWNPTLLVNTESFQIIDEGDGTTDIEIRFGQTLNERLFYNRSQSRFQFTRDLYIGGSVTATGSLSVKRGISGATLRIDGGADIWGNLGASGALNVDGAATIGGNTKVRANLSGSSLRIDNGADIWGTLSASGAIKTRSNLTINSDADTNDAVLTFGNNTANKSITFSNTNQRFEFNDDIKTSGNLSGSTLTVDGNVTLKGQTYSFPTSQSANTFLKTDGNGTLTWSSVTVGNSSGSMLSLHPTYPDVTYYQSGSTAVGTLGTSYDSTNRENYYHWATTRSSIQDYWMSVRVKVPKNFLHFGSASGIVLRLRTGTTSAASNLVTARVIDTAGSTVAITGGGSLKSTTAATWENFALGNVTAGTYTPLGYITLLLKVAATSSGYVDLGSIDLNWDVTTP